MTFDANCQGANDGLWRALFGPIPVLNEPVDARLLLDRLRPRDSEVQSDKHVPIAGG